MEMPPLVDRTGNQCCYTNNNDPYNTVGCRPNQMHFLLMQMSVPIVSIPLQSHLLGTYLGIFTWLLTVELNLMHTSQPLYGHIFYLFMLCCIYTSLINDLNKKIKIHGFWKIEGCHRNCHQIYDLSNTLLEFLFKSTGHWLHSSWYDFYKYQCFIGPIA
jgi:hypothetical protein